MQHLVDTDQFTTAQLEQIVSDSKAFKLKRPPKLLQDKVIVTLFLRSPPVHEALLRLQAKG